jgi:hypothetical protein
MHDPQQPPLKFDIARMFKSGVDCELRQLAELEPEPEMECGDDGRVSGAGLAKFRTNQKVPIRSRGLERAGTERSNRS